MAREFLVPDSSDERALRIADAFGGVIPACSPCGRFVEDCGCACPYCGERAGCVCCVGYAVATGGD